MGNNWKILAEKLGLKRARIQSIQLEAEGSMTEAVTNMLITWFKYLPANADKVFVITTIAWKHWTIKNSLSRQILELQKRQNNHTRYLNEHCTLSNRLESCREHSMILTYGTQPMTYCTEIVFIKLKYREESKVSWTMMRMKALPSKQAIAFYWHA